MHQDKKCIMYSFRKKLGNSVPTVLTEKDKTRLIIRTYDIFLRYILVSMLFENFECRHKIITGNYRI
jgi:hypothetical protein